MIPVLIPAYEPDNRIKELILSLLADPELYMIIVNDGSGAPYDGIFKECEELLKGRGSVIAYEQNHGKGYALKTGFKYVLENMPEAAGVVTADSDGQHPYESIRSVMDALLSHPDHLILGVRRFEKSELPKNSYYGNLFTAKVFSFMSGLKVTDTQTGLRGIPLEFAGLLLKAKEDGFEFETRMLALSKNRFPITEVEVNMIYDSIEEHQTHYRPIRDSLRIGKVLIKTFIMYTFSSLASFVLDITVFTLLCRLLKPAGGLYYVALSTVAARIISGTFNFFVNFKVVFKGNEDTARAVGKYVLLALMQMSLSAIIVTLGVKLAGGRMETLIKIITDGILFFFSYHVQAAYVYNANKVKRSSDH